ncbi:hypothetical protein JHN63_23290 [Streptomyces sp. MBT65]|uniref:hypothetical protein n=1 Tax=Streptomyces sp. MBT65 TaxID=1488395 RepID=UPI0019093FD2|nr:hypothetical protein [Streptomyces sp. MBT65]MBK3576678.1 hypothetical protein [Streptomyces sp. MBT65]
MATPRTGPLIGTTTASCRRASVLELPYGQVLSDAAGCLLIGIGAVLGVGRPCGASAGRRAES